MKLLLLIVVTVFFISCVESSKKKASVTTSPIVSKNDGFRIEVPSTFNIRAGEDNKQLLVVIPQQAVLYRVDNEGVASICESDMGQSICFHSAGTVTITATNSSGDSVVKTIEVFGALDFGVDKNGTVSSQDENNLINLNVNGGFGRIEFIIDDRLGDSIGTIVGNQFIPPTRENLSNYLLSLNRNSDYANIFIKAVDERGNTAIKNINVFLSAIVDVSQQVPLVCDQRNILTNSFFVSIEGGLPQQNIILPEGANLNVSLIQTRSEENPYTIFKLSAASNCVEDQIYSVTLKDSNENTIDLDVQTISSLNSTFENNLVKDGRSSVLQISDVSGENTTNSINMENNSDQLLNLNLSGARAPYRVFISSPKSNQNDLPVTSNALKLALSSGVIPISSNDFQLFQRANRLDCAPIVYDEENDQSVARILGDFNGDAQFSIQSLNESDGFYRIVVVDCNGVYRDHDFYKTSGGLINISNNFLNAGSPFSNFTATFNKNIEMDITLLDASSDRVLQNLNGEDVNLFSRFSSQDPANCNGFNCLTFVPNKIFEGVESLNPAKVKISLTDNAGVTFSFDKYIYPGFKFQYFDRLTNQFKPFTLEHSQNYEVEFSSDANDPIQQNFIEDKLSNIKQVHEMEDFLGNPKDIKIDGGIGLIGTNNFLNFGYNLLKPNELLREHLAIDNLSFNSIEHYDISFGESNYPWFESCLSERHDLASVNDFNNIFYKIRNEQKNILFNAQQRGVNLASVQDSIYFSSRLSGAYRVMHENSSGQKSFNYLRDYNTSYDSYDRSFNENDWNPIDKRIMNCFENRNDPCDFWTEDILFKYPEGRRTAANSELNFNNRDMPWLEEGLAFSYLRNFNVAKMSRNMRLGAALNKKSYDDVQGLPNEANVLSNTSGMILYQFNDNEVSKICINRTQGFVGNGVDLRGWTLSADNKNLCHTGVNLTGSLMFPYNHAVFYYQESLNSPVSKMIVILSGSIINLVVNYPNLISESRIDGENGIYNIIGSSNNLLFIETNQSSDSTTCSDSPENTNLLVVKNDLGTSRTFTSTLLNYVSDRLTESKTMPNAQVINKTVYQKNNSCDFGSLTKGILKINNSDLSSEFITLQDLIQNEDMGKIFITDYSQLNVNGESNLYLAGVRKDQKRGTEKYARLGLSASSRNVTLNYDAPFLIKVDSDTISNSMYKLFEKPEVSYNCHRNTEINNVSLFLADAKDNYPDGNIIKTVNLIFNLKGAYHQLPFNNYFYSSSSNNTIGYLGLNQHLDMEFFHRLRSSTASVEIVKDSFGLSDSAKIMIKESGRRYDYNVSGYVPYAIFTNASFVDFRER